jgi:hypothetical protein
LQGRSCAVSTGHSSTRERQIPDTTPETVLSFHKRGAARAPSAERGWTKSQPRGGVAPFESADGRWRGAARPSKPKRHERALSCSLFGIALYRALATTHGLGLLRSDGCKCQRCARI